MRRWARSLVRALVPLVHRPAPPSLPRLLVIFLDGVGASTLRRGAREGLVPFLSSLRDGPTHRESRAFSGMPSTTTAFQAGLFFGLRHPDVPAFNWLDRRSGREVRMNSPTDAAAIEAALRARAGDGLFAGGSSYLSILAGGSPSVLSTAGFGRFRQRLAERGETDPESEFGCDVADDEDEPPLAGMLRARAVLHTQTAVSLGYRIATETPAFLAKMAAFLPWFRSGRHELNYLINHLGVGTLASEVAKSSVILDLVRGVPRSFVCLHEYDEHSHRRGPREAMRVLPRIDRSVEALFAIAAEVPDPPDVFVITDHGHIPAVPFERIFGHSLEAWLRGEGDDSEPRLPREVVRTLGRPAGDRSEEPPTVVNCGDYAHVYLGGGEAWPAEEIVRHRPELLARALSCPGIGLMAMRARGGPIAFAGARRVDPDEPDSLPRGASARGIASLLDELAHSPSAGDLLLVGSWFDDASIAFTWELSSHGGPSPEETETFVLHPAELELGSVAHGADLHMAFRSLYAPSDPDRG